MKRNQRSFRVGGQYAPDWHMRPVYADGTTGPDMGFVDVTIVGPALVVRAGRLLQDGEPGVIVGAVLSTSEWTQRCDLAEEISVRPGQGFRLSIHIHIPDGPRP